MIVGVYGLMNEDELLTDALNVKKELHGLHQLANTRLEKAEMLLEEINSFPNEPKYYEDEDVTYLAYEEYISRLKIHVEAIMNLFAESIELHAVENDHQNRLINEIQEIRVNQQKIAKSYETLRELKKDVPTNTEDREGQE